MSDCVEWAKSRDRNGYGVCSYLGRMTVAHRAAFQRYWGVTVPRSLEVMHECDNRACINPEHLAIGTHAANIADRQSKGRQAQGEGNGKAKLTRNRALAIRALVATGRYSQSELGRLYGISHQSISRLVTGTNWKGLDEYRPVEAPIHGTRSDCRSHGDRQNDALQGAFALLSSCPGD